MALDYEYDKEFLDSLKLETLLTVKAPDIVHKDAFIHDLKGNPIDCNIYHPEKYGYRGFVIDSLKDVVTTWNPTIYTEPKTNKKVYCIKCLNITCIEEDGTLTNKDGEKVVFVDYVQENRKRRAESEADFIEIYNREFKTRGIEDTPEGHQYFKDGLSKHTTELINLYEVNRPFGSKSREDNLIILAQKFKKFLDSSQRLSHYSEAELEMIHNRAQPKIIYKVGGVGRQEAEKFADNLRECRLSLEEIHDKALEAAHKQMDIFESKLSFELESLPHRENEILNAEKDKLGEDYKRYRLEPNETKETILEALGESYGSIIDGMRIYEYLSKCYYVKLRRDYFDAISLHKPQPPQLKSKVAPPANAPAPGIPHLNPEAFNALKSYFKEGSHQALMTLLKTGNTSDKPLLFIGCGNQLAYALKQLFESAFITQCNKKQFKEWIMLNFEYQEDGKRVKQFKMDYLNKITAKEKKDYFNIYVPKLPIPILEYLQ